MHIAGIAAEYNPFHNGHAHHIAATRAAGASHIVAVMSGSFVQRAETALLPKQMRAEAAILGGADLVLELPVPYAAAVSERFARGAVQLLDALGCVETLSFGAETAETAQLRRVAETVEQPEIRERIKTLCCAGTPYAAARAAVVRETDAAAAELLGEPNNLLAVDYLRALARCGERMKPLAIPRAGAGHDSGCPRGATASASYIRSHIDEAAAYVPDTTAELLQAAQEQGLLSGGLASAQIAVLALLRGLTPEQCRALPACAAGPGDRLYRTAGSAHSLQELYDGVKTRRYAMSRVRRAVLAALLGITDEAEAPPPYARILALGVHGAAVLREMGRTARIPVSASLRELEALGGACAVTARLEARAADLFALTLPALPPRGWDYTLRISRGR